VLTARPVTRAEEAALLESALAVGGSLVLAAGLAGLPPGSPVPGLAAEQCTLAAADLADHADHLTA
jgi:hypothetical protein